MGTSGGAVSVLRARIQMVCFSSKNPEGMLFVNTSFLRFAAEKPLELKSSLRFRWRKGMRNHWLIVTGNQGDPLQNPKSKIWMLKRLWNFSFGEGIW